jgi:hypothetical protein
VAQTLIQVLAKRSTSLREAIIRDQKLGDYSLKVSEHKRSSRPRGWSKLHSTNGADGAVNIEWDGDTRILMCRVVTKGTSKPAAIVADVIRYLLSRYQKNIESISVIPR